MKEKIAALDSLIKFRPRSVFFVARDTDTKPLLLDCGQQSLHKILVAIGIDNVILLVLLPRARSRVPLHRLGDAYPPVTDLAIEVVVWILARNWADEHHLRYHNKK